MSKRYLTLVVIYTNKHQGTETCNDIKAFTSRFWIRFLPSSTLWSQEQSLPQTQAQGEQLPQIEETDFQLQVTPAELYMCLVLWRYSSSNK